MSTAFTPSTVCASNLSTESSGTSPYFFLKKSAITLITIEKIKIFGQEKLTPSALFFLSK